MTDSAKLAAAIDKLIVAFDTHIPKFVAAVDQFVEAVRPAELSDTCDHPDEYLTVFAAMGNPEPKWICNKLKGGCGFAEGFNADELAQMGQN